MRPGALALLLVAAGGLGAATPARAGDGVIEINQARALAGGVTPGDGAGFPVTLSLPGSYRLTGNLSVAGLSVDAISVASADVALDLAGFEIRGPVTCSGVGSGLSCAPAGSGFGVRGTAARSSVRNGHVVGFGSFGVSLGAEARIEHVTAESNGGAGIRALDQAVVREVVAYGNGGRGIDVGPGSVVARSAASGNGNAGVYASSGCSVSGVAASDNATLGVRAAGGSVIEGSSAYRNEVDGVEAADVATVADNAVLASGFNGMYAGPGSNVQGNALRGSGNYGLVLAGGNASFRENTISGSGVFPAFGGVDMLDNACDGAATCP